MIEFDTNTDNKTNNIESKTNTIMSQKIMRKRQRDAKFSYKKKRPLQKTSKIKTNTQSRQKRKHENLNDKKIY